MVRSGTRGLVVDTLPLTTRIGRRHLTLALPGASIKGALRAHAEFIERTARGLDVDTPVVNGSAGAYSAAFRAQLDQLPAVRALFGAARDDSADRRAGALRAEECTSTATIPDDLWRSVTGADTEPSTTGEYPESVRDRLEDLGMSRSDHVALDRWTGGAADGRLFSVLEPHAVEWEPIRLSLDLTRLGDDDARHAPLALLLLTLATSPTAASPSVPPPTAASATWR
ncbi:RAMP superfamily CRISPR-associated protein [Thermocatellispora tengchongensis]|uniref:RAMP superfamily CRISPR-associated protein n=1 Tax=Thermocatellispora tengchongensis TaxID=1073253 RepID=UPI003632B301